MQKQLPCLPAKDLSSIIYEQRNLAGLLTLGHIAQYNFTLDIFDGLGAVVGSAPI